MRQTLSAILAVLLVPALANPCGVTDTCAGVSASFVGTIEADGIRATWSTDDETAAVESYQLRRWNGSAWQSVAKVYRDGTCSITKDYVYNDLPGAETTYRLEVWAVEATSPACYYDVVPQ